MDRTSPSLESALASKDDETLSCRCIWVNGPVIVGAGPSGLAVAAGLRINGVPFMIVEQANCIASLWQHRAYDRLKLHLPKKFCQLPYFPFAADFPEYPSKDQFISYLESYAEHFYINPQFNESVQSAKFDETSDLWKVNSVSANGTTEYICRWIIVATGENAEPVVPTFTGIRDFGGDVIHASNYRSGEKYRGKRVLVVGCGNSGMEISLDLCHHHAMPFMVARSSVHVLPKSVLGKSTFDLAMSLGKWLPLCLVDWSVVLIAKIMLGKTEKYGLRRPSGGPLQLKNSKGKTPVLDLGTFKRIRSGEVKVVADIKEFSRGKVELVSGETLDIDSVVLATGYRSNAPSWLKEKDLHHFLEVNSSGITVSQRHRLQIVGKGRMDCTQLGSVGEVYLAWPRMLSK